MKIVSFVTFRCAVHFHRVSSMFLYPGCFIILTRSILLTLFPRGKSQMNTHHSPSINSQFTSLFFLVQFYVVFFFFILKDHTHYRQKKDHSNNRHPFTIEIMCNKSTKTDTKPFLVRVWPLFSA